VISSDAIFTNKIFLHCTDKDTLNKISICIAICRHQITKSTVSEYIKTSSRLTIDEFDIYFSFSMIMITVKKDDFKLPNGLLFFFLFELCQPTDELRCINYSFFFDLLLSIIIYWLILIGEEN